MLALEAEEGVVVLKDVLDRLSAQRGHAYCRKLLRQSSLRDYLLEDEQSDVKSLKAEIFGLKNDKSELEKRVQLLTGRVKNRDQLLEQQRMSYMKEIIGLKEALFSGSLEDADAFHHHQIDMNRSSVNNKRRNSSLKMVVPKQHTLLTEELEKRIETGEDSDDESASSITADMQVERFKLKKPGLGSFNSNLDEVESHINDESFRSSKTMSNKQKLKILSTRLQSAQGRINQLVEDLARAQDERIQLEEENQDYRRKLETLEKFDVKSMKNHIVDLKTQLEEAKSASCKLKEQSMKQETHFKGIISDLENDVRSSGPKTRAVIEAFAGEWTKIVERFQQETLHKLQRYEDKLRTIKEGTKESLFAMKFSPRSVQSERLLIQMENKLKVQERTIEQLELRLEEAEKESKKKRTRPCSRIKLRPSSSTRSARTLERDGTTKTINRARTVGRGATPIMKSSTRSILESTKGEVEEQKMEEEVRRSAKVKDVVYTYPPAGVDRDVHIAACTSLAALGKILEQAEMAELERLESANASDEEHGDNNNVPKDEPRRREKIAKHLTQRIEDLRALENELLCASARLPTYVAASVPSPEPRKKRVKPGLPKMEKLVTNAERDTETANLLEQVMKELDVELGKAAHQEPTRPKQPRRPQTARSRLQTTKTAVTLHPAFEMFGANFRTLNTILREERGSPRKGRELALQQFLLNENN